MHSQFQHTCGNDESQSTGNQVAEISLSFMVPPPKTRKTTGIAIMQTTVIARDGMLLFPTTMFSNSFIFGHLISLFSLDSVSIQVGTNPLPRATFQDAMFERLVP